VIGLYYYNARWYDPDLGRFIQADTVIANASDPLNYDRYAYVDNNPINHTDSTGHFCDEFGNCYNGATNQKYTPTTKINWSFYNVSAPPKPPSIANLPQITAFNKRETVPMFKFWGFEFGFVQTQKVIIGNNNTVTFPPNGIGTTNEFGNVLESSTYFFNDNSYEYKTSYSNSSAEGPSILSHIGYGIYNTVKPNHLWDFQLGTDVMTTVSNEVSNGVTYQVNTGEYVSYSPVKLGGAAVAFYGIVQFGVYAAGTLAFQGLTELFGQSY
jgi:RHS repeat-associated protein